MPDLRWILDKLPLGVWVGRAPGGELEYANDGFQEILGVPAVADSRITDAPVIYRIFDRAGNRYPVEKLPFSRALATRAAVMVDDIVIHRPDGARINTRSFGVPVFDAEHEISHVIVAFYDITREVEVELSRDSTEARLALAVNHAPIVIWAADKNGVVTLSEGAGLASLGVKSGQLVGQNLFELYRDHPTIPGHIRRGLAGESFWTTVEVPGVIYDTYQMALRDAGGEVVGVAAVSNDVTELRRLQANAIQNDRAIAVGTLAASVAHEINNPLTYLLAHFQMTERDFENLQQVLGSISGSAGDEARAMVQNLRSHLAPLRIAAERIAGITRQLKTFSRSQAERLEPVDLRDVVRSVLQLVGKDLEARARLSLGLEEACTVADEAKLVQVVLNLVVNAMHAVEGTRCADAEILIRTCSVEDRVTLEVEDSGAGVPASDRERIFDPFFSTKGIGEGSGLGLFVCRNIARGFGGDIAVEDRALGGARFRLSLPGRGRESRPLTSPEGSSTKNGASRQGRILLVDDEPLLEQALADTLRHAGHEVTSVRSGAKALEILLSPEPFDLVYCDLMMRGMTGMDLASTLEERAPGRLRRIVFMSGGAFTQQARDFLERHREQSVDKPFDIISETRARLQALK
jgi:two-component system cell cycle sensor histidine kinase/response regulator CckA